MTNPTEADRSSQWWLFRRFKDLRMKDIHDDTLGICVTSNLVAPTGFEKSWEELSCLRPHSSMWSLGQGHVLMAKKVVLIICNVLVPAEVQLLSDFISEIVNLSEGADTSPHLILVPHTTAPEVRKLQFTRGSQVQTPQHVVSMGIDGVLSGEPEGHRLALCIQSRIKHAVRQRDLLYNKMNEMHDKKSYETFLADCNDKMQWEYLRAKVAPSIPAIDAGLQAGVPTTIMGFRVGERLGKGSTGLVHKLYSALPHFDGEVDRFVKLVLKLVPKDKINDIKQLKALNRSTELMQLVSTSNHWHFNIARVYEVLQSPTYIIYIMEDGGPSSLHSRLRARCHADPEKRQPLPLRMVISLLLQAVSVVDHLHSHVALCHRDIKPENMTIKDSGEGLVLKLIDFEYAAICKEGTKCKTLCGTLPFTAPEVLFEKEYDGCSCDMWSLGVTFLEVLCGLGVVERMLGNGTDNAQEKIGFLRPTKSNVQKIRAAFSEKGSAGKVVQYFCLDELGSIRTSMTPVLNGLVCVNVQNRWKSTELVQQVDVAWAQVPLVG